MTKPSSVLVVDDDPPHRHLIAMLLREQIADGTEVHSFPSGPAALEHLAAVADRHRSLILSDYVMPQMSGLDLLREIQERHGDSDVRFIAISSVQQAVDEEALRRAGASEFIVKPYELEDYVAMLRRVLNEWDGVMLAPNQPLV